MAFDGRAVGTEQPAGHPVVNHRRDGVRDVIRLAVADHRLAVDVSGIRVQPQQHQARHDVARDQRLDGRNPRPAAERMLLRGAGRAGEEIRHSLNS